LVAVKRPFSVSEFEFPLPDWLSLMAATSNVNGGVSTACAPA
jgi:hypothetical protein